MQALVSCPQCNQQLRVPPGAGGRTIRCPLCGFTFVAPKTDVPRDEAPAVPMPRSWPKAPLTREPLPRSRTGPEEEPLWVVPVDPAGENEAGRVAEPIAFTVLVREDPDRVLKGRMDGELTPDGLYLRKGTRQTVLVPVGTPARCLEGNTFRVELDGRQVTLAIRKARTYVGRLTRDVAAFLNGRRGMPHGPDYVLPWSLFLPALLPLGIPAVAIPMQVLGGGALWGGLWGGLGAGLCGAAYGIAQRERWRSGTRVLASCGLAAAGYLILAAAIVVSLLMPRPYTDESAWQAFAPPGGRFRVRMPGTPVAQPTTPNVWGNDVSTFLVQLPRGNARFAVSWMDVDRRGWGRPIPPALYFDNARDSLLITAGTLVVLEKDISRNGNPGREVHLTGPHRTTGVAHLYLVGRRIYALSATGRGYRTDSPDVVRFLDSFQADPPPAEPNPPPVVKPPVNPWPPVPQPQPWQPPAPPRQPSEEPLAPGGRALNGNRGPLAALAFSPDGKTLFAACEDDTTVIRWDLSARKAKYVPERGGHRDRVAALRLSPDGRALALAAEEGGLQLIDPSTGGELCTLQKPGLGIWDVAFSPHGRVLASAHSGEEVKLWDLRQRRLWRTLPGHGAQVRAVAFSPDGRVLAASTLDRTVRLWDMRAGGERATLRRGKDGRPIAGVVQALAFSPDGKTLATGDDGGFVRLWDVPTATERLALKHEKSVTALAYDPGGKFVAAAGGGNVWLWDAATGARVLPGLPAPANALGGATSVPALVFSPDGTQLAVARGSLVELRPLSAFTGGKQRPPLPPPAPDPAAWDEDLTSPRNPTAFNAHGGAGRSGVTGLALSADGTLLATGGREGSVRFWDTITWKQRPGFIGFPESVQGLALTADGRTAAACGGSWVYLWDQGKGRGLPRLSSGRESATAVAFSPDGKTLAQAGHGPLRPDRPRTPEVQVWDWGAQKVKTSFETPRGVVRHLSFSGDGRTVITAGPSDRFVRFWDAATGQETTRFQADRDGVHALASTPDGKRFATTGSDVSIRLWDATGKELSVLKDVLGSATSLALTPDARLLAAAFGSRVVLWDVPTARRLMIFYPPSPVISLALTPDGRTLIAGREDGLVSAWNIDQVPGRSRAGAGP